MAGHWEGRGSLAKNHPYLQRADPAWPAMSTHSLTPPIPPSDPTKINWKIIESASDWNENFETS
jgi:hypothetical protein